VFSSEVDTGSREENTTNQKPGAPVLIPSEPESPQGTIPKTGDRFSEKIMLDKKVWSGAGAIRLC
jgi:hypothetical protein